MRTKQESVLDILGTPDTQLIIPVYQRVYAWTESQCKTLWNDIVRAGRTGAIHFMGTVLYGKEASCGEACRRIGIIDGQQRLATLSLLIAALRDHLRETDIHLADIDADTLTRRYLILNDASWRKAPREGCHSGDVGSDGARGDGARGDGALVGSALVGSARGDGARSDGALVDGARSDGALVDSVDCKLLLSRIDRATYAAIVNEATLPEEEDELSQNVVANYQIFQALLKECDDPADAEVLWSGIKRLVVISAFLDEEDHPQHIFESLNSKGRPLATSDLIRNLLLINSSLDEQERLYEHYWEPIESLFSDDLDSTQFVAAMRGWLATKAPHLGKRNTDDVYATFKAYLEAGHTGTLEDLLRGLKGFCETFVVRSQSSGAQIATAHNSYGVARVEGIISEKKLFGD